MKSSTIKIITYVVISLVAVLAIGFAVFITNGFTEKPKSFYVDINGDKVASSASGYLLEKDKPLKCKVKFLSSDKKNYTVQILSVKSDFTYFVDGKKSGFTVSPKGNTVEEVLKAVYPNGKFDSVNEKGYENMFTLVVTSYDCKANVKLNFSLSSKVSGVTLDKEGILF